MFRRLLMSVALLALFLPAVVLADNIGQINQVLQGNDFILTDNTTNETLTGTTQVYFTYAPGLVPLFGVNQQAATLTISAQTFTATDGSDLIEGGWSGYFKIIDNYNNQNLLTGTFGTYNGDAPTGKGSLNGDGYEMTFADSTSATSTTQVVFTSAYLNFMGSTQHQAFSFSLSNLSPVLSIETDNFLSSATAAGTGTFSATPGPTPMGPEPATLWLTAGALAGFGFLVRKRKLRRVS